MQSNKTNDIYHLLRNKKSEPILNELKQFINTQFDDICIKHTNNISKISNEYQDFLFKITLLFSKQWSFDFECNQSIFSLISDAFESLLTKALNRKIFNLLSNANNTNNKTDFNAILNKYSFLTLNHLGITIPIDYFILSEQIRSFVSICQLKSTLEKSICVVNLCNYLSAMYPQLSLVLLLTYTLISSSIPLICENILFISLFRSKAAINSVEDYYIDQITSAIDLIKGLETNNSFLSINHFQFENYCLEYEKRQLAPLLIDKSINEVDNKDKDKENTKSGDSKVDNSLISLMNKIFFVGSYNKGDMSEDSNSNSNTNTNSILKAEREKGNEALMNIPIDKLQNEYCAMEFKEMSYSKIVQLYKDYKILLKIIESSQTEKHN